MKKILVIPEDSQGIIDVRKVDYLIINKVSYLEDIYSALVSRGKSINKYKFCQFESDGFIPFFINIKDKLSTNNSNTTQKQRVEFMVSKNYAMLEFEIERITFNQLNVEEDVKKQMLEERYIAPNQNKIKEIVYKTAFLMASEKLGDEVNQDNFINLKIEKEKLDEEISQFDYKKHLNEIV